MTGEASRAAFHERILDGVPAMIVILDADARVRFANRAAAAGLGIDPEAARLKRGGDVLRCVHRRDAPGGCGFGEHCLTGCVIRRGVGTAVGGGEVRRERLTVTVERDGAPVLLNLLLTASPLVHDGETLALLTLDDVSELIRLQSILPICACCKKIRNDADYWESVEEYIAARVDVSFSHGFCPECYEKHYGPDLQKAEDQAARRRRGLP
jgi:hypothetical protein